MTDDYNLDPHTHARTNDPETSHEAARRLNQAHAESKMKALLHAFADGTHLTAEQAAVKAGLDVSDGPWKRVSDLTRKKWLEATGVCVNGSSGRPQRLLQITPLGLAEHSNPNS